MTRLALVVGEPYRRRRKAQDLLSSWREALGNPEVYKYEAGSLHPEQLHQVLSGRSLFNPRKIVHLSYLDEIEDPGPFVTIISQASFAEQQALLAESGSIDKRSKLYKTFRDRGEVTEFDQPKKRELPKYISQIAGEKGVELSPEARKWMAGVLPPVLLRVDKELSKLARYPTEGPLGKETVRKIIWTGDEGRIFDFLDKFSDRDLGESLRLLKGLVDQEVSPSKIFFMLAGEVRLLLSTKALSGRGYSDKEIARETGKFSWLIGKKRSKIHNFEKSELRGLLEELSERDRMVKTGQADVLDSIFEIVFSTCR